MAVPQARDVKLMGALGTSHGLDRDCRAPHELGNPKVVIQVASVLTATRAFVSTQLCNPGN